jgi:hypothetical protein
VLRTYRRTLDVQVGEFEVKFERCCVCDYTREDGSAFSGATRGQNGVVRYYPRLAGSYCQTCASEVVENYQDLITTEDDRENPQDYKQKAAEAYALFKGNRQSDS